MVIRQHCVTFYNINIVTTLVCNVVTTLVKLLHLGICPSCADNVTTDLTKIQAVDNVVVTLSICLDIYCCLSLRIDKECRTVSHVIGCSGETISSTETIHTSYESSHLSP